MGVCVWGGVAIHGMVCIKYEVKGGVAGMFGKAVQDALKTADEVVTRGGL